MNQAPTFKRHTGSSASLYRACDILSVMGSLFLAGISYGTVIGTEYVLALAVILVVYLYVAELFGLYRSWRAGKFREMVVHAWLCVFVAFSIFLFTAFVFKFTELLSRVTLSLWFMFALSGIFASRFAVRMYKSHKHHLGVRRRKVAIVGATQSGANLYKQIFDNQELGLEFTGFFDDRAPERVIEQLQCKVDGSINDAVRFAKTGQVDILYIALPMKADKRIADILLKLGDSTVDVHIVPDFLLSNLIHARIDQVGNMDTLSVFESPYYGARQLLKRTEDICLSAIILCLIAPIMLLIALAVKLTSQGPILFKQYRYGLGGEKIEVWKFRSMSVMENGDSVKQATKNDVRVTTVGRILRRTSLDELPQFFNVLTGQMSIVGPRPHAVSHNEEYRQKVEFYMLRHKVKPGITGWAQINGWRGETDTLEKMEKRVQHDLFYIKNWSLWFDIKIILLTLWRGFKGANAY